MIVRCVSEWPSEEQIEKLGEGFSRNQSFGVKVGREYVVLALDFFIESNLFGTGAYIEYPDDEFDQVYFAPLCLFEIVDPRASRFWEARYREDKGWVTLRPPSFYRDYYKEDLFEGVPEIVEDFRRVRALLEYEATGKWEGPYPEGDDREERKQDRGV